MLHFVLETHSYCKNASLVSIEIGWLENNYNSIIELNHFGVTNDVNHAKLLKSRDDQR